MNNNIELDIPLVGGQSHNISPMRIEIRPNPFIKDLRNCFFAFGSCFAAHISHTLSEIGFASFHEGYTCNHYSARSLAQLLSIWKDDRSYDVNDLYCFKHPKDRLISPYHTGLIQTGMDAPQKLIERMESVDTAAKRHLKNSDFIILTLGTATHIRQKETGKTICQRMGVPSDEYDIVSSSVDDLVVDLRSIYTFLDEFCPRPITLFITISPQRYSWISPSPELDCPLLYNNLDKAKLRVAIDIFLQELGSGGNVLYFPSFDIVMDELRLHETLSHSFQDHTHVLLPHTPAYVINRFLNAFCSNPLKEFLCFNGSILHYLNENLGNGMEDSALLDVLAALDRHMHAVHCTKSVNVVRASLETFLRRDALRVLDTIMHRYEHTPAPAS